MSNPPSPHLEMRFLGSPEVLLDGQPVRFRSRKVLALLAYLAIEGGSHRREKLIDLFWPDSPPGKGAATLRSTLSRLRESLGAASGSLVSDGDGIRFDNGNGHYVDVAALEVLSNAPMRVIEGDLHQVARGRLFEGFSVGGSPEFDDWVGRWSALCLSRSCALLERAARWHIETGQLADAEKAVSRWMTYAPYDDAPVMLMVEVHALRGGRVAALETYEKYVELMRSEMGAEPGDQLEYLIQRVRHGQVGHESPHEALRALLAKAEEEVAASRAHVAVVYLDQAVALLDSVGAAEADELTNETFTKRGRALELSHRFEDAVSNYEELAARADHAHNLSWKLSSLIGRTCVHSTPTQLTDPVAARLYGEQALDLARLLGDREKESEALWSMLLVDHYSEGDEEAALEHGLAGLEIAREFEGSHILPHLLNDMHWVQAARGNLGEAASLLTEAIAEWERADNEAMLIDSLNGAGLLYTLTGDYPAAISAADRGAAIALRTKNVWNQLSINANLALLHREQGNYRQGLSVLRAAIDAAAAEMPVARPYYQVMLATLLGDFGRAAEVDEICNDIEAKAAEVPPFWRIGDAARTLRIRGLVSTGAHTSGGLDELAALGGDTIGLAQASTLAPFVAMEAALALGDYSTAIAAADAYLARAARAAARFGCAEARLRRGQAQLGDGAIDEAIATLTVAQSEADEHGLLRIRWQIQEALAAAFVARGEGAEAHEWWKSATDSHAEVSVLIPRGELRKIHDARQPNPTGEQ